MKEDFIIENIVVCLRRELPSELKAKADEFAMLVKNEQVRASYGLLLKLIDQPNSWEPSSEMRALVKAYEFIF